MNIFQFLIAIIPGNTPIKRTNMGTREFRVVRDSNPLCELWEPQAHFKRFGVTWWQSCINNGDWADSRALYGSRSEAIDALAKLYRLEECEIQAIYTEAQCAQRF